MNFLRNHLEKIILGLALLGLMGTAVYLALQVGQWEAGGTALPPKGRNPEPLPEEKLQRLVLATEQPPLWRRGSTKLFGPTEHYWDKDRAGRWYLTTGKPRDDTIVDDTVGIPRQWFLDHELDPNKPGISQADSDGDGFSNAEEFTYKTHPNNADSFPQVTDYLFLFRAIRQEFKLRFYGYSVSPDGVINFQINVRDFDKTYFVRLGERVGNENFKVTNFEKKTEKVFDKSVGAEREVEKSELTLTRLDDGQEKVLVYKEIATETTLRAILYNKLENRLIQNLSRNDTFQIRGKEYKVVDIKSDEVLVSDSLNQEYTIRPQKAGQ